LADQWLYYGVAVGLFAVGIALLDRGYGAYRTAKKGNPDLKFSADYIINIIVAAGGMGGFFGVVFPVVLTSISTPKEGMDIIWIALQFVSAYFSTIGVLDKLNRATEGKTEATVFKKLALSKGNVTVDEIKDTAAGISGNKDKGSF
jgi:hypothetical protein